MSLHEYNNCIKPLTRNIFKGQLNPEMFNNVSAAEKSPVSVKPYTVKDIRRLSFSTREATTQRFVAAS